MSDSRKSDPKSQLRPRALLINTSKPRSEVTRWLLSSGVTMRSDQMGHSFGNFRPRRSARLEGAILITSCIPIFIPCRLFHQLVLQKERGFMQSRFVLDVATIFLRHSKAAKIEYRDPRALFSLIAAGVCSPLSKSPGINSQVHL